MADIRKLQFIGNQHLLNIPKHLARRSGWKKGDYLEIVPQETGAFIVRKIAEHNEEKSKVTLAALEQEATGLYMFINAVGDKMSGGDYAAKHARFFHVTAKIRKLKQKLNNQTVRNHPQQSYF